MLLQPCGPAAPPLGRPRDLGDVRRTLAAQSDRCVFQIDNVDRQGSVNETPQGTNYFAGGNVRLSCRGQQITMQSDSVAAYGGNVVQFIGNVKYRDSTLTMDADRGTYYKNGEKWEARGQVVTKNLKTGSTLTGPALDYFRVVKGVRDTLEMYATGRPRIQYATTDAGGQTGRALHHRGRPGPDEGQRSALGRRQGDDRPQRLCGRGRFAPAGHGEGKRRHPDRGEPRACAAWGATASP